MWSMATHFSEGIEKGQLSDFLEAEVEDERMTKDQALLVARELRKEAERIIKRGNKFKH